MACLRDCRLPDGATGKMLQEFMVVPVANFCEVCISKQTCDHVIFVRGVAEVPQRTEQDIPAHASAVVACGSAAETRRTTGQGTDAQQIQEQLTVSCSMRWTV